MAEYDDKAVENVKDKHYCMQSMEARNNENMNKGLKYNDMKDMANTAHPPTQVKMDKQNKQLEPKAVSNNYDYNSNR